ncbi:hypothetical protein ABTL00_20225, partial [Acinetobacter baumannii]
ALQQWPAAPPAGGPAADRLKPPPRIPLAETVPLPGAGAALTLTNPQETDLRLFTWFPRFGIGLLATALVACGGGGDG